jgi:Ran GTPase-activating protein (RanGAP) involved in mRNA processing and transport
MKYRITPQLISLTYEAALKSFWRKNALKKFLKGCNISDRFLNSWNDEETKRSFLDRLFMELQKDDKGKQTVLQIAIALSEQTYFPDLQNWEDSENKIKNANVTVQELKKYLEQQVKQIKDEETKEARRKTAFEERVKYNVKQQIR